MLTLVLDIVLIPDTDWIIWYCLVQLANLKISLEIFLFGITCTMWHKIRTLQVEIDHKSLKCFSIRSFVTEVHSVELPQQYFFLNDKLSSLLFLFPQLFACYYFLEVPYFSSKTPLSLRFWILNRWKLLANSVISCSRHFINKWKVHFRVKNRVTQGRKCNKFSYRMLWRYHLEVKLKCSDTTALSAPVKAEAQNRKSGEGVKLCMCAILGFIPGADI